MRAGIVPFVNKMALGVLLGLAMTAGVYTVAARGAYGLAATFVTTETASHARNVDFASAVRRTPLTPEEHACVRERTIELRTSGGSQCPIRKTMPSSALSRLPS
jgi:hypothetical protein